MVPEVVFDVVPVRVEQVDGVNLAEGSGHRGLHALSVVAPDHDSTLRCGVVADIGQRRIVWRERIDQQSAGDRLDEIADIEQHDVAVADYERPVRVMVVS